MANSVKRMSQRMIAQSMPPPSFNLLYELDHKEVQISAREPYSYSNLAGATSRLYQNRVCKSFCSILEDLQEFCTVSRGSEIVTPFVSCDRNRVLLVVKTETSKGRSREFVLGSCVA